MTRYTPQWLQAGSYSAAADRRLIGALWPGPASVGVAVTPSSGMTVNVAPGAVAVPSQNNTGSTLCSSDAVEPVTLSAAAGSGLNRYDLIICRPRGNDLDGGSNNDFIFDFVTGVAVASPVVPATPAGTVALAQIYVPGASASVTAPNITDVRPLFPSLVKANLGRAAALSCPVGNSVITLDTAVFDPAGCFNTGGFRCPVAGSYVVGFAVNLTGGAASGQMQADLQRNGTIVAYGGACPLNIAIAPASTGATVLACAAGDMLRVGVYNGAPAALNTSQGAPATYLAAHCLASP